jgi:hypothetical protein
MSKSKIVQVHEDVFFIGQGGKNGAVLEFTAQSDRMSNQSSKAETITTPFVPCYKSDKDTYWDNIIQLTGQNGISPSILETKRQFVIGGGITLYKEVIDDKGKKQIFLLDKNKYPEIKDFIDYNDLNEVKSNQCDDLLWFGNYFEQNTTKGRGKSTKILDVIHVDATTCRSGKKDIQTGVVPNFFLCDEQWSKARFNEKEPSKGNVERLEAFNNKMLIPKMGKALFHGKGYSAGFPYYPKPAWHGLLEWMRLSNKIPAWHLNGIENGYHIKYHIKIPLSYFDKFPVGEREKRKTDLRENMNDWLSGVKNVQKAFVSYKIQNGVATDEWDIVPIEAMLHDEAFTTLYDQTQLTITSGHGVHPALAGIQIPNKLSNASEQRIAYLIYMSLKTNDIRQQLLKPLYLYKKINGWADEVMFGFENIEVTTLDVNPTGSQTVLNP